MSWTTPDITDFTTFCQNQGIVASYTAVGSEYFQWAFDWAMAQAMQCPQMPASLYVRAVYNFGADKFLYLAQDNGQGTFYADQRAAFGILQFKPGVVMASGDGPTSQTLVVPDWYRGIPINVQEQLKTPWGREYLGYAQQYGIYVVGVS
ncbi:hypothetical protein [Acidithiobacillus sp.]|uniref:hypothetical protein n=1 Tax=Acidithiobacillus sp. TaxID=1872118 RepID=UPI003D08558B